MFSFTGLTPRQCDILINKHHVYLIKNGRVAVSMINESNYKKIAESIKLAIE
jgi:aspartate/tyrosine/aromatic aminotransferase